MKRTSILQRSGEAIANPAEYRQPTTEQLDGRYPFEPDAPPEEPEVSQAYGVKRVQKLLRIISDSSLSTKTRVLALSQLRDIVSSQEVQAQTIREDGVLILSRGIKREWQGEQEVPSRALAGEILAELALNRDGRSKILRASSVPILIRALRAEEHRNVRIGASLALCSISEFRDGLDIIALNRRLVEPLVASLADRSTALLANMTRFFANITGRKDVLQDILQNDATAALIRLLSQGKSPHRRKILVNTLVALGNLAHSKAGNKIAIGLSAAKRITDAAEATLQYVWEDVARACAGALLALSGSEAGKKSIHAYAIPLLAVLVQVEMGQSGMRNGVGALSTKNNAASALRFASEYPPALEQALQELLPSTKSIVFVFGANAPAALPGTRLKALRVLTRWLLNSNFDMRILVVRGITALLQQDPEAATEDAMGCLYIVRDLLANARDYNTEIGRLAAISIAILCRNSAVALKKLRSFVEDGAQVPDEVVALAAE